MHAIISKIHFAKVTNNVCRFASNLFKISKSHKIGFMVFDEARESPYSQICESNCNSESQKSNLMRVCLRKTNQITPLSLLNFKIKSMHGTFSMIIKYVKFLNLIAKKDEVSMIKISLSTFNAIKKTNILVQRFIQTLFLGQLKNVINSLNLQARCRRKHIKTNSCITFFMGNYAPQRINFF